MGKKRPFCHLSGGIICQQIHHTYVHTFVVHTDWLAGHLQSISQNALSLHEITLDVMLQSDREDKIGLASWHMVLAALAASPFRAKTWLPSLQAKSSSLHVPDEESYSFAYLQRREVNDQVTTLQSDRIEHWHSCAASYDGFAPFATGLESSWGDGPAPAPLKHFDRHCQPLELGGSLGCR